MILHVDVDDEAGRWLGQMATEVGITTAEMAEVAVYNIVALYIQERADKNILAATSLLQFASPDGNHVRGKPANDVRPKVL